MNGDITGDDKTAINNVISKANVDGVAEAVAPAKKADIVAKSSATVAENDKVEIEVAVKVEAKAADLANGKLTFEASPVATVKVNGTATGTTVPVTNDMLNGNAITVKLPLPTGFKPEQIKHISSDGSVEYFLKTAKRGANTFEIKDGCAVFTITKFSTFELSGTVTYVEPSYYSGSSSDPTYSVTVDKTENGSVTVSPKSASKGSTVTITVKPDSGYTLETLTAIDSKGKEIQLTDKGDGKYTFTMPAGKVEVKATFMEDNSMLNFFYDVPNGAYFYEAVKWAVKNGITTGVGNDLFAPEQPCTRAQIVTFLWRAAGSPEPKGTAAGMTDVVSGSYYEKAVAWAIENGITTGTTATTFSPDATCTRGRA
ncbi:MAG: S-layer homology domain-containing protein [Oscillibacter sp.]